MKEHNLIEETFEKFGINKVLKKLKPGAGDEEGSEKQKNREVEDILAKMPDYGFLVARNLSYPADFFK